MKEWPLEDFTNKDVVFVGAGQGRSMSGFEDFITKHGQINSFVGVDKREEAEPLGFLRTYNADSTVFIKNEGIPGHEMPVPYVTPINIFFDCVKQLCARTVGITGTKGKSTTASLTAAMIRTGGYDVRLAGNIGTSVFHDLDSATKDTVFVVELSSYQLSDIAYSPDIAACINLYNDHSDWHGSLEAYWEAKHKILAHMTSDGLFVYNPQFPTLRSWAQKAPCRTEAIDPTDTVDLSKSLLYGNHNVLNALVAQAIANGFNISKKQCQEAIDTFKPLAHRMEFVGEKAGHIFIDDAIGMTPESTIASLLAVGEKYGRIGCVLLGGQDRGYDFTVLFHLLKQKEVPALVLFPDTIQKMRASLPDGYSPAVFEANDMKSAVEWAHQSAPPDSVVLLSTAAPSYSLWKNGFEEKGRQFQENVIKIT